MSSSDDERRVKRSKLGDDSEDEFMTPPAGPYHDEPDTVVVPDTADAIPQPHEPQSTDTGSEQDDSDEESLELDDEQAEIVAALEESMGSTDGDRITLPPQEVRELQNYAHSDPQGFLREYGLASTAKYSVAELLSSLGFPLLREFAAKYSDDDLVLFLPLAIQHFRKTRRRLPSPSDLEELKPILKKAKNILVLTGAGISTSLGIPDFRSKHGLYNMLGDLQLADPQEVFDISLFREDPSIFYKVAKMIAAPHEKYSPTHQFIKLLYDKGKLLRNYTQNIDNIEANAGVPPEKLVQCHGSFATVSCLSCPYKADGETIQQNLLAGKVAKCPDCAKRKRVSAKQKRSKYNRYDDYDSEVSSEDVASEGVLKPDITFFGEKLPNRFDDLLYGPNGDAKQCDLVICIGTSLKVAPVSNIITAVSPSVPQIVINKQRIGHLNFDVSFLGGCDDVVEWLAEEMGWELEHEMNKRQGYASNEFPGGKIRYDAQTAEYHFESDEPEDSSDQSLEEAEYRAKSEVSLEPENSPIRETSPELENEEEESPERDRSSEPEESPERQPSSESEDYPERGAREVESAGSSEEPVLQVANDEEDEVVVEFGGQEDSSADNETKSNDDVDVVNQVRNSISGVALPSPGINAAPVPIPIDMDEILRRDGLML